MKQCPTCRTTYTDDSLRFCLADGGTLVTLPDGEATLLKPTYEPVRVDVDSGSSRAPVPVDVASKPSTTKIVLVIGLFAALILGAAGVAGALLYFNRDSRKANIIATPTPVATPSATPDTEKQKLQDQLANIQKQLDEQKASNKNTTTTAAPPLPPAPTGYVTARVNSPGDGFLALRDKPNAVRGNVLEKIPHGATVTIENCGPLQRRLGGRVGRWCMITYNGKTGYAFDAFLDRQ